MFLLVAQNFITSHTREWLFGNTTPIPTGEEMQTGDFGLREQTKTGWI